MKKLNLLLLLLGLFAMPAFAAPTITFNAMGEHGTYSGFGCYAGEMLYTASDIAGVDDGQFVSFCVEADEHVNFGGIYDAQLNDAAWQGGIGGGNPDQLSNSTAWLYNYYLDNVYGSSNGTLARDYQMAIWYLEEEISAANYNDLTNNAKDLVTLANSNSTWNNTTIMVLNLYNLGQAPSGLEGVSLDGKYIQDCLVRVTSTNPVVPVPGAILLGGIGVSLVGWLRRRRTI